MPSEADLVTRALRRVRPSVYRLGGTPDSPTLLLTVAASAGGRRNAADRVVAALADGGFALDAGDPVGELAGGTELAVRRART